MRNRRKRNFADGDVTTIDSAVSAANLVTMLDPNKMDQEAVEMIADVTGTSEEFVDGIVDLVDNANAMEDKGYSEVDVVENFSAKASAIVKNFSDSNPRRRKKSRNFADGEVLQDAITDAVEVVSLLDTDTIECCTSEEIAETISAVTEVPVDVIEPIVAIAQSNFSAGKKLGVAFQRKLARKKLFAASDPDPILPSQGKEDPNKASTTVATAPVVAQKLDDKDVLQTSENDPKPGDVTSDPTKAGEAMAVANDLAIVENIKDVPSNFSTSKDKGHSNLRTILGANYIPNED